MSDFPLHLQTQGRRVLVVDDHPDARRSVVDTLSLLGFDAIGCESPREALRQVAAERFDLIITDLMMPGMDGLQFLTELQRRGVRSPTLMVTAHGSVETAVRAMRTGAFDYLEKPFDVDQLEGAVRHALERGAVVGRRSELPDPEQGRLIGQGAAMTCLKRRIAQVAGTDVTVLITGESGTGKELVARAIHLASARKNLALVSLNCPALSPALMESELFGHEQGAFTNAMKPRLGRFELAHRGTIFLDEVTEIDAGLQSKLLRVLQERTFERVGSSETRSVDVRVIAATNRDLSREVAAGRFREDLRAGEDTEFNARIPAHERTVFAVDAITAHRFPTGAGAMLREAFRRGQLQAATQGAIEDRGPQRVRVLLRAPWSVGRSIIIAARSPRPERARLVRSLPLVVAGSLAYSAGALTTRGATGPDWP